MIRRIAIAAAFAIGVTAAGVGAGSASAQGPVGPECRAEISRAVLASLNTHHIPTMPGQVVQYVQLLIVNGQLIRENCVVIVPA